MCYKVSGYDDAHISANIQRCELALKYGLSSGDRYDSLYPFKFQGKLLIRIMADSSQNCL